MTQRTLFLGLLFAAVTLSQPAAACHKFNFETKEAAESRCRIEARMPFEVKVRRMEKGFMAFLSDKRKAPNDSYIRDGVIVLNDGTPMTSSKDAELALRKVIQKGRGCKLAAHDFKPGKSFTYQVICPRTPPAL